MSKRQYSLTTHAAYLLVMILLQIDKKGICYERFFIIFYDGIIHNCSEKKYFIHLIDSRNW